MVYRTPWKTSDIWLRQEFDSPNDRFQFAELAIFHDEDTEVYVNGQLIWKAKGYLTGYRAYPVTDALNRAIKTGSNLIAIHTRQTGGGQYIDAALLVLPEAETASK